MLFLSTSKKNLARFCVFTAVLTWSSIFSMVTAYTVQSINYPSNGKLTHTELKFLQFILEKDGLVAFTKIPGLSEARHQCLVLLGKCYHDGLLKKEKTLQVELADGTKRLTLATDQNINDQEEDFGCHGLAAKMSALQAIVDHASHMFAGALDETVLVKEEQPLFMALNNPQLESYQNFSSVVEKGSHLDHFHIYEKPQFVDQKDTDEALELHTDQGLFVAIVPSITVHLGHPMAVNDGFEVEMPLPEGLSQVTFPNNGDAILFMLGDGIANWIDERAVRPVRSVPHRLLMHNSGYARAWFGRMFFPPKDAFIHRQRVTFDKLRMESVESGARNLDYSGCSNKHHMLRDITQSSCGANEIFCWMACRSTIGLTCNGSQSIQCVNQDNGNIWTDKSAHCFKCVASCYTNTSTETPSTVAPGSTTATPRPSTDAPPTSSPPGSICNSELYATNMYMDGFNGLGSDIPCLVFLFQNWVMDTEVKYAWGSIGCFLIGLFIEYIILLRREVKRPKASRPSYLGFLPDGSCPHFQLCLLIFLYLVQLVFAYFAMLLAMSFAAVIFVMIMLGLTTGRFLFNPNIAAGGNEACCSTNEQEHLPPSKTTTI